MAGAILIPIVAVAGSQEWWFFRFDGAPPAATPVAVVREGVWDGKPWQLVAYRSTTDGICFGITPQDEGSHDVAGALACAPLEGVPSTGETKDTKPLGIMFVEVTGELPYIAGPVVERATEVVARFAGGLIVRTPTFAAPDSLGSAIRFYASRLPNGEESLERLVGLDADSNVVACAPAAACG